MAYLRVQLGDIWVQNTCYLTKVGPTWAMPTYTLNYAPYINKPSFYLWGQFARGRSWMPVMLKLGRSVIEPLREWTTAIGGGKTNITNYNIDKMVSNM